MIGGARPGGPISRRRLRRSAVGARPLAAGPIRLLWVLAPSRRVLVGIVAILLALGGAWLWVRDSSLVAVHRVTVTGESGPDAGQIRSALIASARNMSTLDVHVDQLRTAVAPYPVVKDLQVRTQFPHGMRIHVVEQVAVGVITVAGHRTAVAGDGTLLHDVIAPSGLPEIPLRLPPAGTRVSGTSLAEVRLLAAAPEQLLDRVSQATSVTGHGLVAQIRNGPSIYFGDASQLPEKWIAAAMVLADSRSAGAVYIDVTVPQRPAAGAGSNGSASSSTSTAAGG